MNKNPVVYYNIKLEPELRRQIAIAAATESVKLSDWVRDALRAALSRYKQRQNNMAKSELGKSNDEI